MTRGDTLSRLQETREAFDSVAADYDGPRGNNPSIQDIREEMWHWLDKTFTPGGRLLDLGCGTGLDAVRMGRLGYRVTATDWSPRMVARTGERAQREGVQPNVQSLTVGAHELQRLDGEGTYDGAYSNLGPLNCVPDQGDVARQCARLLKPGGMLVFSVIGRWCPWELTHYLLRRRWQRASVRFARRVTPVGMNKRIIWTAYFTPREFFRGYERDFELVHYRGLCLFAPPPYLTGLRERRPETYARLWRIDRRVGDWPVLRAMGDHFLIVMRKKSDTGA